MKYDYLIVGAGLYGAVFAHELTKAGKSCLVIDRRSHIAGNVYTESVSGIQVHKYGAHIFHTSDREVWEYVNQFAEFNHYVNSPVAIYKEALYNLPFNMNTFSKMWGIRTPAEAKAKIAELENLSQTIRSRQARLKKDISLIDQILAEDTITEAHLRLLIEKILVTETEEGISLEIQMKAPFQNHTDTYDNGKLLETILSEAG